MRIGFLLPGSFALGNPGNGIAEQARRQAEALERRGHTLVRLNPWQWQDQAELDVLHFFLGGATLQGITSLAREEAQRTLLVFAPIIDSNQSYVSYRLAALAGNLFPRVMTVPGILRDQAQGSHVVLCRSTHERERLVRGLGVEPEKVECVLNGCPAAMSCDDIESVRQRLQLPPEFVLHVSAFTQERKNVLRLVEALEPLRLPLVIAGSSAPNRILSILERKVRDGARIHMLGFVDAQTKAALYRMCRVFCLPSVHEGTGLAALEAAAHGARVVITRNGGTRDYFLDHAEYVDPFSVPSIREGVSRAWRRLDGGQLQRHVNERLTWDASAAALERIYEKYRAHA